ncbi:HAD family phosphatase [uncultured Methanomethylovorans sp.]|uniref:HAD family hydrolase n=1 Tax=uncultured Methanomethylovorans sp. TaxID=183759 RepID=UPI002AA8D965|nr:HAD family phosphatase [uncultured Methanomethylovorans sp.]
MRRALIFDMDGVLVDSMHMHAAAWKKAFLEEGIAISHDCIYRLEGANDRGIVESILHHQGIFGSFDSFSSIADRKQALFNIKDVKPFPGISDCLELLSKDYLLAVVSGSDRNAVDGILGRHFSINFNAVVSGDDIVNGKPNPDPYLKAMEYLGADSENCIVFENAPYGVEAAKRAGIYCVGIPTYVDPQLLGKADKVLECHSLFLSYLQDLTCC